jgi:hypothetical protein
MEFGDRTPLRWKKCIALRHGAGLGQRGWFSLSHLWKESGFTSILVGVNGEFPAPNLFDAT